MQGRCATRGDAVADGRRHRDHQARYLAGASVMLSTRPLTAMASFSSIANLAPGRAPAESRGPPNHAQGAGNGRAACARA